MKKVLFTATVDSHIKQFHIPYLKLFKDKGYEVHVATNGIEEIKHCDKKHTVSFERNPIKLNNLKAIKQLKKIIEKEKFDIIHCHTPMGGVVTRIAAIKARKKYGTRVIYTAHGFHFFKGAPILNWIIYYPIEKICSRWTDTLITINSEDYELAKKKFKKCKDVQLVHGVGVDEKKFKFQLSDKEKNKYKKELGIEEDDVVIIYVAELLKRKNQEMLIIAVDRLIKSGEKVKLLLPGIDSEKRYYQKIVNDLGITENVKFLGYRTDIPNLLKISNIYVSTAKQEGLPVNIMEAMFCNLPIIATNCRGNRDLIKNCVKINDVDQLISKINKTINQNEKLIYYNVEKIKLYNVEKRMKEIYNQV